MYKIKLKNYTETIIGNYGLSAPEIKKKSISVTLGSKIPINKCS